METLTGTRDVYTIVTERIIKRLEEGIIPWKKPWTSAGAPTNIISKKRYKGINVLLLSSLGYEHNLFITENQLKEIGGYIRKGEKSNIVTFWNWVKDDDPKSEKSFKRPFLRYYRVFNVAQCQNIPLTLLPISERENAPIIACEKIYTDMQNPPELAEGYDEAWYDKVEDMICMPSRNRFLSQEDFYATLYHELIHSTGNYNRLYRSDITENDAFGSVPYSREELVAEFGAGILCSETGILPIVEENSVAYIQSWLNVLKGDKKILFEACSSAQKAVDYILGRQIEMNMKSE